MRFPAHGPPRVDVRLSSGSCGMLVPLVIQKVRLGGLNDVSRPGTSLKLGELVPMAVFFLVAAIVQNCQRQVTHPRGSPNLR